MALKRIWVNRPDPAKPVWKIAVVLEDGREVTQYAFKWETNGPMYGAQGKDPSGAFRIWVETAGDVLAVVEPGAEPVLL